MHSEQGTFRKELILVKHNHATSVRRMRSRFYWVQSELTMLQPQIYVQQYIFLNKVFVAKKRIFNVTKEVSCS